MSRRPFGAANADPRPDSKISRRQLIAGSVVAVISDIPAQTDPAVGACRTWFELEARHQVLIERWQQLESYLIRRRYWCDPDLHGSAEFPEARELQAIDTSLDELDTTRHDLLIALAEIPATTALGVSMKLDVLASVVPPDENQRAHHLVMSIRRNLKAIKL